MITWLVPSSTVNTRLLKIHIEKYWLLSQCLKKHMCSLHTKRTSILWDKATLKMNYLVLVCVSTWHYKKNVIDVKEISEVMFCHLAVIIYLCWEVRKKGYNCSCPFERKGNWISVNVFLYFNSKVCKRLPKKGAHWKINLKNAKKWSSTFFVQLVLYDPLL